MQEEKPKILFLPAWYPNRKDSMYGLFVRNHALTVLPYAKVFVLTVIPCDKSKKNYEVEIETQTDFVELKVYYKKSSFPIIGKFINLFRFLMSYIAGWKVINNGYGKPDLVHVHILTRSGIPALYLKWFKNIPYVVTEHWSRYFKINNSYKGFLRKAMTKIIVKNASAMSTVSKVLKEAMNEHGLHHSNWEIIPNSIDTKLFQGDDVKIDDEIIRMFHISCFEESSKNMSGILRAFSQALLVKDNLQLVMIGDGVDLKNTKELAKDLNIQDKVIFKGVLEKKNLIEEMNKCQFSVLFSHYETFAIVIAESLASEKPVIATKVGAIPEILPEEFGILVEDNDEEALKNAILKMADNYKSFDGDAMREYCVESFDKEEVGRQLFRFYKSVYST